jgi:hypothetical protein
MSRVPHTQGFLWLRLVGRGGEAPSNGSKITLL